MAHDVAKIGIGRGRVDVGPNAESPTGHAILDATGIVDVVVDERRRTATLDVRVAVEVVREQTPQHAHPIVTLGEQHAVRERFGINAVADGHIRGAAGRGEVLAAVPSPRDRHVIDHVSVSWAGNGGKNFSTAGGTTDVTISNCIDSEAFPYGMLLSESDNRVSVLRCLFAHNFDRNPHVKSGGSTTFINNDIYNPGGIQNGVPRGAFSIWANVNPTSTNPNFCNIVGNTAKLGPTGSGLQLDFDQTLAAGSQCYLSDNAFANGFLFETGTGMVQVNSFPFTLPTPLTILASGAAEAYITAHAGARPSDRDPVDTRIINDVINLTGNSQLTNETQLGGFPALAQTTRVLAIPADYATLRPSGYTVLEEDILFPLATQVGGGP